jgi:hypothetical protein
MASPKCIRKAARTQSIVSHIHAPIQSRHLLLPVTFVQFALHLNSASEDNGVAITEGKLFHVIGHHFRVGVLLGWWEGEIVKVATSLWANFKHVWVKVPDKFTSFI